MKVLKAVGFMALAVLVFVGFVYPFFVVPRVYEEQARVLTMERISGGSVDVKDSYIEESIKKAYVENVGVMFKTACLIACGVALIIFCLSVRPPHDCGGINLFNPIGLIFVAGISMLLSCVLGLAMNAVGGTAVSEFNVFVKLMINTYSRELNGYLLLIAVPAALEIIFRGIIFSYLEKTHFSFAIVVSALMYAVAVYFMVSCYTKVRLESDAAAKAAMCLSFIVGIVEGIMVWRLRSGIPAVLSHILIAYTAPSVSEYLRTNTMSLPLACVLLGAALAVFVFFFTWLNKIKPIAKREKLAAVFNYDFPLTKHHEWMMGWLYSPKPFFKKKEKSAEKTEKKPAVKAEEKTEATAEEKPEVTAEEKPVETAEEKPEPAEEKPAETAEEKPEATAEEKPEATAEEKPEVAAEENPEATAEEKPEVTAEEAASGDASSEPSESAESEQ